MLNHYQTPSWHVDTRTGFPDALKPDLLEGRFTDWKQHPQFLASGAALHGFHNRLRRACEQLTDALGKEAEQVNNESIFNWRLPMFGQQIISTAHAHHHAEDHVYFPQYQALFPQLERPLKLLDADHRVLEQSLDTLEHSLSNLDENSEQSDWERCREQSEALSRIIHRHLDDEEEIVMPAIMRRDS